MASLNKVILIGHLGGKPEVRETTGGKVVANFSLATSESWSGKDGQRAEKTEWHRVVVWGQQAEAAEKYLDKGSLVNVEGKLQTRTYEKDGTKHSITEVVAERINFLSSKRGGEAPGEGEMTQSRRPAPPRVSAPSGAGRNNSAQHRSPAPARPNQDQEDEYPATDDDDVPF